MIQKTINHHNKIQEFIKSNGSVSIEQASEVLGLGVRMSKIILDSLVEQEILEKNPVVVRNFPFKMIYQYSVKNNKP